MVVWRWPGAGDEVSGESAGVDELVAEIGDQSNAVRRTARRREEARREGVEPATIT